MYVINDLFFFDKRKFFYVGFVWINIMLLLMRIIVYGVCVFI